MSTLGQIGLARQSRPILNRQSQSIQRFEINLSQCSLEIKLNVKLAHKIRYGLKGIVCTKNKHDMRIS